MRGGLSTQAALSSVCEDLTGAPVVDVRRIEEHRDLDAESALAEVIGYVSKPPKFESVAEEVEYLTALKGSQLVQPFGSLHGNTPRITGCYGVRRVSAHLAGGITCALSTAATTTWKS